MTKFFDTRNMFLCIAHLWTGKKLTGFRCSNSYGHFKAFNQKYTNV